MEYRTFIPGSEWVYFKLYTGTKTADEILKNEINSYVNEMLNSGLITKWFFIRYSDPDFHIRLRLHLKEVNEIGYIFNCFCRTFERVLNSGFIWNIQCDTYQREIERYGYNSISLIEDIFYIDSDFVIRLLHQLNEDNHDQLRWKSALVLIESFLSAFSFDLLQRKNLLNGMAVGYKKEFGFTNHQITKQLNDKYRDCRNDIENAILKYNEVQETTNIIDARRNAIAPISNKLISMKKNGELQVSLDSLLPSLIHMTMNRWFRTKNRLHEMVIYEFLSKYYTSEVVKNDIKY